MGGQTLGDPQYNIVNIYVCLLNKKIAENELDILTIPNRPPSTFWKKPWSTVRDNIIKYSTELFYMN